MVHEPWFLIVAVVISFLVGACSFVSSCGCVRRWRWRRQWRALTARNAREFVESGHSARFFATQAALRNEARAKALARRHGTEGAP